MAFTLLDWILTLMVVVLAVTVVLLLQRTGRQVVLDKSELEAARREAERILEAARQQAQTALEQAQAQARTQLETARAEAQSLRQSAQAEVQSLRQSAQAELERLRTQGEERLRQQLSEERERLQASLQAEQEGLARERERLQAELQAIRAEREELKRETERLARRGEQLDLRAARLDAQEEKLDALEKALEAREAQLAQRERQIDLKLQEVAGLSQEEARQLLLSRLDAELEEEKALRVKASLERARLEAKREAQKLLAQAAQRQASETAAALAVSVVPIPSDAMKGRIIGREGRNIRTFEALTGVDLIIDDTPEAVLLSSFNPMRREIARMALEQLVQDGRIHPSRIEEVVEKAKNEMKTFVYERGEEAALEAGVVGLKPGLVQLLGRLHFRSSYGQNVLKHSIQVAHLTGIMAAELGLDAALARRAGLLHDLGKSVDREIEGTHVEIGITLASRFGEPKEVIDAIAHHHDPENGETLYSVLVAAADAISAARPGARRESLEEYIQRLEQLERIALSFPGVEQAFAVQAGREVRVIVKPERISDAKATLLAREIAGRIERDMNYPGQVQVTVVRESRAVEYAR
ncbi:ribonuclease Y [Meiothermus rufus]|uniref:ribonuclease Y n=1 Tax=Meiothermus rufus TaxID=604332 RepID=UPI0003F8DD78|nr:ribonuclease Y [Meiothermus rufus]